MESKAQNDHGIHQHQGYSMLMVRVYYPRYKNFNRESKDKTKT